MSVAITVRQAREFLLRTLGLQKPFANVAQALEKMGYVQMDPINVCGRMHDLILRNRVANYREGDLLNHAYQKSPARGRVAFEHYLPNLGILVTFPVDAWPFLIRHMDLRSRHRSGYTGKLSSAEEQVARHILAELTDRGPLTSNDIEHDGRVKSAWGAPGRLVKVVLQKMFAHGRVLIADRRNFRRVYDLPERVMPHAQLKLKPPPARETERWLILQKLKQRRLVTLRRQDVSLVDDLVQCVEISGVTTVYCLKADAHLLNATDGDSRTNSRPRLLAPLDPLIYDRKLTSRLWDFDYTWEVYTPPQKRTRGYYALPLLAGLELVGHVDPKAERKQKKLQVSKSKVRRGHKATPAIKELASFLGLKIEKNSTPRKPRD